MSGEKKNAPARWPCDCGRAERGEDVHRESCALLNGNAPQGVRPTCGYCGANGADPVFPAMCSGCGENAPQEAKPARVDPRTRALQFLARAKDEANALADELDPKRRFPEIKNVGTYAIVFGLMGIVAKAKYVLNLPTSDKRAFRQPAPSGVESELLEAARDADCGCSVAERDSGHRVGCWMPALIVAIKNAEAVR